MKRRSFLKLFGLPAALLVPTIALPKPINDTVIVLYNKKMEWDAGYFYAPYIPVQKTTIGSSYVDTTDASTHTYTSEGWVNDDQDGKLHAN